MKRLQTEYGYVYEASEVDSALAALQAELARERAEVERLRGRNKASHRLQTHGFQGAEMQWQWRCVDCRCQDSMLEVSPCAASVEIANDRDRLLAALAEREKGDV